MAEIKEAIELLGKIENKVSVPCHVNTSRCGNCGECMWCWLKQVFILLRTAQEQPPAGECFPLTCKDMYEVIQGCCGLCPWCVGVLGRYIKQERDRSEASRNELLTALECFPKKLDFQTYEQFYNHCMSWIRTHQDVAIKSNKEISGEK